MAAMLVAVAAHAGVVPERSVVLPGIDEETVRERMAQSGLQLLEGVWEYPAEEMRLAIERHDGDHGIAYRIIMLLNREMDLTPGTVIGYIAPSAVENRYQLWIYSERDGDTLKNPKECVATLNAAGTSLTFEKPKWKLDVRVNVMRFLPTLFRGISINPHKDEQKVPIGFTKTYPTLPSKNQIIYL